MDYEEFYQQYLDLHKFMKDKQALIVKAHKNMAKDIEGGDLKNLDKNLSLVENFSAELAMTIKDMQILVDSFDSRAYMEQGFYARQMLELCEKEGVDVIGDYPNYEIFPFSVRLDAENQEIYIDRKRNICARPVALVRQLKVSREKLLKASFNANQFSTELAKAYDLALKDANKPEGHDLYLTKIYQYMVPMNRFRREYDLQSYAFDIARLFSCDNFELKDGRQFQFGPSRNNKKAIRILDAEGHEQYLATIRFFR